MNDDRLRALYAESTRRPDAEHPPEDTMQALAAGRLSGLDHDAVLEHLARCGECAEVAQHLMRCRECAAEVGIPAPATVLSSRPRRWAFLGTLAAAAGLTWVLVRPLPPPVRVPEETLRAGAPGLIALEPAGRLAARPSAFRWQPVPDALGYQVVVLDGRGERVWTSPEVGGTALPWPGDLPLVPGTYFWQVVGRMAGGYGGEPMASPTVTFEIP